MLTITPNELNISIFPLGHTDTLCAYCTVGLPVSAVFFSMVSGVVTALIMCCAGKRKRRRRRRHDEQLAETGPVYEIPHYPAKNNLDMKVKENVCYDNNYSQCY